MANAIIMASGLGTRMRPLTEHTPKPLIRVHGTPMIESVINALRAANVQKITVVVGYLKEQFGYLPQKYPELCLRENPDYRTVNNISSVFYAKDELLAGDTFICEADLFVADPNLFVPHPAESCYYGKFVPGHSDDWVFEQDATGRITRVGKGGANCYNMVGISYFAAKDAAVLSQKIAETYGKAGYETLFWDDVVNAHLRDLPLRVLPVSEAAIYEIDTVSELNAVNGKENTHGN